MNLEQVRDFEKLKVQMQELYKEISLLSKKSPDSAINKFKLKMINKLLATSNDLLDGNLKPFDDFDVFDEADMPTNSDVVVILSQYIECLEKLKLENVKRLSGNYYWIVDGENSNMMTTRPPETLRR